MGDGNNSYKFQVSGSYSGVYLVWAKDEAGNMSDLEEVEIKVDRDAPVITDVSYQSGERSWLQKLTRIFGFRIFGKETLEVTVSAQDIEIAAGKGTERCSGVKRLTYWLNDDQENAKDVTVNEDGKFVFKIAEEGNYKGNIKAVVTDAVGNTSEEYQLYDTVIEKPESHAADSDLEILLEPAEYQDEEGNPLYNESPGYRIQAKDTYSGIAEIQWKVLVDGKEAEHYSVYVDINGTVTAQSWENEKTDNLVTALDSPSLLVSKEVNYNKVTLWVQLTDRAGNTTQQQKVISIDKTPPEIEVRYDNNAEYLQGNYQGERKAEITIFERNFDPDLVKIEVTGQEGRMPEILGWTTYKDLENPDRTRNIATITYPGNGDYTFRISCTDRAGLSSKPFAPQSFCIDSENPRIQVTYKKADYEDKNKSWYHEDVQFKVDASDNWSGIYSVRIK